MSLLPIPPSAPIFTDISKAPSPATSAVNQMQTDSANLSALFTTGSTVWLRAGSTYVVNGRLTIPSNFRLKGSYSKLKVPDQLVYTTTAATSVSVGASNATFTVASTTGMYVGMEMCIQYNNGTQKTFCNKQMNIANGGISGNNITVSFSGNFSGITYDTSNNTETTIVTSFNFPIGTVLATVSQILTAYGGTSDIQIDDVEIIGNRTNQLYGTRWETAAGVSMFSDNTKIRNLQIDDAMSDAIIVSGEFNYYNGIFINRPNGNAFHLSDGGTTNSRRNIVEGIFVDSPGMLNSGFSGHWGGSTSNPTYGGIICSNNEYEHLIEGYQAKNTSNSKMCCGITHFNDNTNRDIRFNMGKIRDMSHGAFEIRNTLGTNLDPYNIYINQFDILECGPQTAIALGISGSFTSPVYANNSQIGYSFGNVPLAHRVIISGCTFENSPLFIEGATGVELRDISMKCTTATKSCSLVIVTSGSQAASVDVYDVRVEAPLGDPSASRSGWSNEYYSNVFIDGCTVQGNGIKSIGASTGFRVQNSSNVDVISVEAWNNYDYGYLNRGSGTSSRLQSFKARMEQGAFTQSSGYIAVEANQSGSDDGNVTLVTPDINLYTTFTTQSGVSLSAATGGNKVMIDSGIVIANGSAAGKAFSGGGASTKNEFIGTVSYDGANFLPAAGDKGVPRKLGAPIVPTFVAGTGAGTAPTITISGTEASFTLNVTTGTTPATSAIIATVTLPQGYAIPPGANISAGNATTAALAVAAMPYLTTTKNTIVINSNTVALTLSTAYSFNIITIDRSQDGR